MVLEEVKHEQALLRGLPASSHEGGCATNRSSHRAVAHGQYEGFVAHLKVLIMTCSSRLQSFLPQFKGSGKSGSSILGGLQTPSSVPKESLGEAGPSQSHTSGH